MSDKQIVSFLEPRSPFINTFNRKFTKIMAKPDEIKKNLVYHMGEEKEEEDDTIKVFLRLKPCENNKENYLEVLDYKTLLAKVPQFAIEQIVSHVRFRIFPTKYTFSHIYGPTVTQKEVFSSCVEKSVEEFLNGKNCLLFCFGTTNVGKTYTVQGNADNPGIIPRVIATIFKSIEDKQNKDSKYCPLTITSAHELTQRCLEENMELKNRIINWSPEECQNDTVKSKSTCSTFDSIGEISYRDMQSKLEAEIVEKCFSEENVMFSVWVSFVEIYNEGIYDLLQPPNKKGKRPQLKLAQDTFKNNFIKDLRHINVHTAEEAHRVLRYGKHNICIASTGMNASSSRSHCIFSFKLSKFLDLNDPENMQISSFSICDLAGAERLKTTLNVGDRLKESQSINNSLFTLSRCFKIIRENQNKVDKQRIPFRDSKLTHLFQNALSGKESITMIVNVNPSVEIYDETQYALKSSAIAKQIVFEPRPKPKPQQLRLSRFSNIINQHKLGTLIPWDSSVKLLHEAVEPSTVSTTPMASNQNEVNIEYYLSFIETLQSKLKAEREKTTDFKQKQILAEQANFNLERDLRKDLSAKFKQMMQSIHDHYKESSLLSEKFHEEIERDKIANLKRRHEKKINKLKQKLNFPRGSSEKSLKKCVETCEIQELINKIENLECQVENLNEQLNLSEEERTQLVQKVSCLNKQCTDADFENQKLKKELEAVKSNVLELLELDHNKKADKDEFEDLQEQLKDLEKQVQFLTELNNNTKEEKTELVQKVSYLNIQCSSVISENEKLKKALEASKSESNELLVLELDGLRKEMAEKIKIRDDLLEDARADLEFERKEKTALEENVSELEKELAVNVHKLEDMEGELRALNDMSMKKNDLIDELESKLQVENYQRQESPTSAIKHNLLSQKRTNKKE